jgi:hypothetical protein
MKNIVRSMVVLLVTFSSLVALADDQRKAEKQVNKISAMAADLTGRRIVNQSMAEQFKLKRTDLVLERRANNLNYGSLFIVHQLAASGTPIAEIDTRLKAGKSVADIANELHADWKLIGDQAKKMNSRIEDNLYSFFLTNKKVEPMADPDAYNAATDGVAADLAVSQPDLADAQDRYVFWRDRATAKQDATLEHNKEQAARQTVDPVRKGGPQADQVGNTGPATPR